LIKVAEKGGISRSKSTEVFIGEDHYPLSGSWILRGIVTYILKDRVFWY
jgi:hypothetical protein